MSPVPVSLAVRARRALARPLVRRSCVAVLAVATAVSVVSAADAAGAARDRWGRTRTVAVATRDLEPGEVLDAGAVETRELPAGLLTPGALADAPERAVVRHPILAGEPLVPDRLAPHGLAGPAALLGPGERAVAVPVGPAGVPPLAVGDLVDVVTVVPAAAEARSEPAFPLVERATVVDVVDDAVTVAVPGADAARVAWALSNGTVVLALAGP